MTLTSAEDVVTSRENEKPNIKGDRLNIVLLLYIYVLQTVPRGLANAIPLILQNRKATSEDQAEFSLTLTTFSFKLLWAPIIDCTYWKRMGRRKSWAVPMQYVIGIILLLVAMKVDDWMGSEDGKQRPRIHALTIAFFACTLSASIQDVAVDGWSLTMLQRRNLGYAGTCNSAGYALGIFFGNVLFIILDSKEFSNYFRAHPQDSGFIDFSDFMFFWSIMFVVSTTLIWIFKKDNSLECVHNDAECRLSLKESYKRLWQILKLGPVQKISIIMTTGLIFFGPIEGVASLKLVDAGVPRDKFVLLSIPTLPAVLCLPFMFGRLLTKQRSLRAFLVAYLFRLIFDIIYVGFIFVTPRFKNETNSLPAWYYGLLLFFVNVDQVLHYALWMFPAAFTNHISDIRFGAMYATLFNSVMNLGSKWSNTLSIWLVKWLTIRSCTGADNVKICTERLDGFYCEITLFTVAGFVWLHWARKQINILEKLDASAFIVKKKSIMVEDHILLSNK